MNPANSIEQRQFRRAPGPFSVDLLSLGHENNAPGHEDLIPAEGINISDEGLQVRLPLDVDIGSRLVFLAVYHHRQYVCMGRVVWKSGDSRPFTYGLQHHGWSPPGPVPNEDPAEQSKTLQEKKNL